ncbi:HD domain-containing protein [Halobacillus salinus]|uniref:HD domain-containing protein n=1 Tax=Halobacillus salinus TaxID=192814 RepID=UPI0009A6522E|nr:HD domain-containing protein [Halobacillus salinus]
MDQEHVIKQAHEYIEPFFEEDVTGHGVDHMKRVALWAKRLAIQEEESPFLAELAGLLHDLDDAKLSSNTQRAKADRKAKLQAWGLSKENCDRIENAIETVSFQKGRIPETMLGKVLQDADRLDAIGAVGIARTFAFGGAKGQKIHSKDDGEKTSISHFYEKLLHIKEKMNTDTGRKEAEYRHKTIERFLVEFERETMV